MLVLHEPAPSHEDGHGQLDERIGQVSGGPHWYRPRSSSRIRSEPVTTQCNILRQSDRSIARQTRPRSLASLDLMCAYKMLGPNAAVDCARSSTDGGWSSAYASSCTSGRTSSSTRSLIPAAESAIRMSARTDSNFRVGLKSSAATTCSADRATSTKAACWASPGS